MKKVITLLSFTVIALVANAKENNYTGSTPVGATLKTFFGIDLKDSIDFMRWKITIEDNTYSLQCNYGLSKPNTNGFINDGKTITQKGALTKEKNLYQLKYNNKILKMVEINSNLLHIISVDNNLLIGNSGWSYTLNNITPTINAQTSLTTTAIKFKDSIVLEGRTPCKVPGIIPEGKLCYKLKWQIFLYGGTESGTYKTRTTAHRNKGGVTGTWKISSLNGKTFYQLTDDKNNAFIYLVQLDEHVLAFTDANKNLLVGDEDFSYTLNRIK